MRAAGATFSTSSARYFSLRSVDCIRWYALHTHRMRLFYLIGLLLAPTALLAQSQFSLQPLPESATAPALLLGVWGSARQCTAYHSGNNQPGLLPYHINAEWLRQGTVYCYLSWRGQNDVAGVIEAFALAQCGEDDLREYQLALQLRAGSLRIRWSADYTTPELQACQ